MAVHRKSFSKIFKKPSSILWALFLVELLYIFLVLLNYDLAWMNAEKVVTHKWILSNGPAWKVEDFARALNIDAIEFDPHRLSRPLSNLCEVINAKFRANLWNIIPPHPSLSILWPFFFIILPICLYRFFINVGCRAEFALGGCMLYMATIGYLGPIVMLFHPAKSLTNLCGIVSLYLMSRLCRMKKTSAWLYAALMVFMLATLLSDETGLFFYVMTCVLFARYFKRLWVMFLTIPLLYFFCLRIFLPWLHCTVRGTNVIFGDYKDCPKIASLFAPHWEHVRQNFIWLLGEHPGVRFNFAVLEEGNRVLWGLHVIYFAALVVFTGLLFWSMIRKRSTWMFWGASVVILLYVFFFTFQLSTNVKVWGGWWYGSLFSIIFVIWMVMALQHAGEYFNKGWQKYFLIIFMLMAVVHTMVFSTYEVDIFAGTAHHPSYEAAQVFNGDMKEYYRDFSLFDSMNRSHCIYLSALQQWALVKHKQISIDAQRSAHCSQMIGHDPAAAYQAAYIAVEMPLGK